VTKSRQYKQPKEMRSRALDEDQRMLLTGRNREVFLDAVANPPVPTQKLITALKRYRRLFGGQSLRTDSL
jgi:hypothetical protein